MKAIPSRFSAFGCSLASLLLFIGAILLPNLAAAGNGSWTLTGWNNLGMHCMDDDYSVFSILPPFNTINAQLIDAQGHLVTVDSGITVSYESVADPLGSINTTSAGKTNFWQFCLQTYGANLAADQGLAGFGMPGAANTAQTMAFDSSYSQFNATGIPITPVDDLGRTNTYPMMRLKAKDSGGNTLASVDIVLPVSSEVSCRGCHASGSNPATQPAAGWANDSNEKRDARLNILRLHDDLNSWNPVYADALAANNLRATGLYDTVMLDNRPILCASCHASAALNTSGFPNVKPLTAAVHGHHAYVIDPTTGGSMNASSNRSACYQCHPGSTTKCLRGAMGSSVASDGTLSMQCQSCHGSMSDVGASSRTGWLDEPNCASCHTGDAVNNNGQIVYTSVFDSPGVARVPVNQLFSTNADTPMPGKSLFRFSKGHGGLQCEACHGSTHAEFPTWSPNDNIASKQIQGHIGKLAECTACHATMPQTINGGPHGMHPIGSAWVQRHHNLLGDGRGGSIQQCQACHGIDFKGTRLSRAQNDRKLTMEEGGTKSFWRGQTIGCYDCHNGPRGEDEGGGTVAPQASVANGSLLTPKDTPRSLKLSATRAVSLRIVSQPTHGTVALAGNVATFYPDAGFVGSDSFTFAASNGFVESNLGKIKVQVGGVSNGLTDYSIPSLSRISPSNNAWVRATGFTVTGAASDKTGIALVEYRIGAGPWLPATGTKKWSVALQNLPLGKVILSFRGTDAAGNQSAVVQRVYRVK